MPARIPPNRIPRVMSLQSSMRCLLESNWVPCLSFLFRASLDPNPALHWTRPRRGGIQNITDRFGHHNPRPKVYDMDATYRAEAIRNSVNHNENYNFLQFSQDFSRENYRAFLFRKLRRAWPGLSGIFCACAFQFFFVATLSRDVH